MAMFIVNRNNMLTPKNQQTGAMMSNLLKIGLVGSIVTALCCFTPILVILFGALGLSVLVGYLDYVLLPLLVVFIGILAFAIFRNR